MSRANVTRTNIATKGAGSSRASHAHSVREGRQRCPPPAGALSGRSLVSLASERLEGGRDLEDARRLLQAALAECLEGRNLTTRTVARSLARRERSTHE